MVRTPAGPSKKALGKQPMRNGTTGTPSSLSALTPSADSPAADEETDDGSVAQSARSVYHKRVLPSRIRRGGGVGSLIGQNEIDTNILDILRRKGENEPLIPARTVFILTTDSSQVPSASTSELGLNRIANERYFDQPEVIKAFKAQQNIQVPEYWILQDQVTGGRLRARSGESEIYELTDEAYEKRHRKHEMMEKRQRLREKEQLQFEHYKLKERMTELRNMDPNAFLAIPSDVFGGAESSVDTHLPDNLEPSAGAAINLQEAERRRKMMLDVAQSLEERYRILLPPRMASADARLTAQRVSASVEPTSSETVADDVLIHAVHDASDVEARQKQSKLKLSLRGQPIPPPATTVETARKRKGPVRESPPPPSEVEVSTSVATPSVSARQRRYNGRKPRSRPLTPSPSEQALVNSVSRITLNDLSQQPNLRLERFESTGDKLRRFVEGVPSTERTKKRRPARAETVPHINMIHYAPVTAEKRPRQRNLTPKRGQHGDLQDVGQLANARCTSTQNAYAPDDIETELPATTHPSCPDGFPPDTTKDDITFSTSHIRRATEESFMPYRDDGASFERFRSLEHPDEDEDVDIDVLEQQEADETPTADEVVTPVEPHATEDSIIAAEHDSIFIPGDPEPAPKRQRRTSTSYVPCEIPSPRLSVPIDVIPIPFPLVSVNSYVISESRRKAKSIAYLLAESKHNVERGRKTGRSVKAFGVEVPPFEKGRESDFEVPKGLLREVFQQRMGDMSDAASDGDPPSYTDGIEHGEVPPGTYAESVSWRERGQGRGRGRGQGRGRGSHHH